MTPRQRLALLVLLVALMAATRSSHIGSALFLPDASWAVFFAAGFYLRTQWRWALPLLYLEAVGIDWIATAQFGVSSYCLTPAYVFTLPAYATLWLGGAWLARHLRHAAGDVVRLAASVWFSSSACFLITNASFYWLGARVSHPQLRGWLANFAQWYGPFVGVTCLYVALAAVLHLVLSQRLRPRLLRTR
jgi:hypothetical protein